MCLPICYRHFPEYTAYKSDMTLFLGYHMFSNDFGQGQGSKVVDWHDLLVNIHDCIKNVALIINTRIVDKDVNSAVSGYGCGSLAWNGVSVGKVKFKDGWAKGWNISWGSGHFKKGVSNAFQFISTTSC